MIPLHGTQRLQTVTTLSISALQTTQNLKKLALQIERPTSETLSST